LAVGIAETRLCRFAGAPPHAARSELAVSDVQTRNQRACRSAPAARENKHRSAVGAGARRTGGAQERTGGRSRERPAFDFSAAGAEVELTGARYADRARAEVEDGI